jgi:hypothetical protein
VVWVHGSWQHQQCVESRRRQGRGCHGHVGDHPIIIVERIKRSRREEVDGGQLKWAVDKSKRNMKAMSRQFEEGNPYSSDRLCTHRDRGRSTVASGHVVAAKAESGPKGAAPAPWTTFRLRPTSWGLEPSLN